jgi:hypothetical protein
MNEPELIQFINSYILPFIGYLIGVLLVCISLLVVLIVDQKKND